MTDINARIRWQPGMVLSAETFGNLDDNIELRQRITVRTATNPHYGLLPDAPFSAKGFFANGCYEIERLQLTALLPTGDMISPDEPVSVPFARKEGEYNYLCVGLGIGFVEYEHCNVPYLRPKYEYSIKTLAEIDRNRDMLPIVRFHIADGRVNVDDDYIIPSLLCSNNPRLMEAAKRLADAIARLAEHPNMLEGDAHQTMLRYLFRLRGFSPTVSVENFITLTQEIVQAVHYFIIVPESRNTMSANPTETEKMLHRLDKTKVPETAQLVHPEISYSDIQLWIHWCEDFLAQAATTLDAAVRVDDTIDLAALKAEIRDELYRELHDQLNTALTTSISSTLHELLRTELEGHVGELIREYTDGTVRQQLHDELHTALRPDLYDGLYRALYEALYDALQKPESVEEHFYTPII